VLGQYQFVGLVVPCICVVACSSSASAVQIETCVGLVPFAGLEHVGSNPITHKYLQLAHLAYIYSCLILKKKESVYLEFW
jgi:hypothetical protein